jgi:hypothetical protein
MGRQYYIPRDDLSSQELGCFEVRFNYEVLSQNTRCEGTWPPPLFAEYGSCVTRQIQHGIEGQEEIKATISLYNHGHGTWSESASYVVT